MTVDPQIVDKFFAYIRKQCCVSCNQGQWNMQKGEWENTVSHVIPRGSANRNNHLGNVVPHCIPCHHQFEISVKSEREKLLPLAQKYFESFLKK